MLGIEKGDEWDYRFFMQEMLTDELRDNDFLHHIGDSQSSCLSQNMVTLAASDARKF